MNYFAHMIGGNVVEVIPEFVEVEFPEEGTRSVALQERYTAEFIAALVPYDPMNPPAPYVAPAPSSAQVMAERTQRMVQATAEIAPLQDLVDMGEADENDEDKLLEWKQYRVAVSKVQTQSGFPESVVWPGVPAI